MQNIQAQKSRKGYCHFKTACKLQWLIHISLWACAILGQVTFSVSLIVKNERSETVLILNY